MGRNNADLIKGRWGESVSMLPVSQLIKYREFDRSKEGFPGYSDRKISDISEELRKGGVEAIREPLVMTYNPELRWAHLNEGNHRLAAAIEAGVTHLPVRFESAGRDIVGFQKSRGKGDTYPLPEVK